MLMTSKAQAVLIRLNKVQEAKEGVDEAMAIHGLRNELVQLTTPIKQLAFNAQLLSSQGLKLSPVLEVDSAVEAVRKVSARFQEEPKSSTLRQGPRWSSLKNKLEALATKMGEVQVSDWKTFFSSNFFGGLPPAQRGAQLSPTPENKKALALYKELYQDFIKYRSSIPKDAQEFERLLDMSEQLAQIEFQEDVPDDVSKFFQAIGTGGAGLELLTAEVIDWLRSNNSLMNYVVRAKQV
jgi:hypothetical protein